MAKKKYQTLSNTPDLNEQGIQNLQKEIDRLCENPYFAKYVKDLVKYKEDQLNKNKIRQKKWRKKQKENKDVRTKR